MNEISTNGPVSGRVVSRANAPETVAKQAAERSEASASERSIELARNDQARASARNISPIGKAEELLNRLLSSELGNSRLRINRHDAAGRFVYESIDKRSGEVVKQFPPEKILEVLAFYNEAQGLVIDDEA